MKTLKLGALKSETTHKYDGDFRVMILMVGMVFVRAWINIDENK